MSLGTSDLARELDELDDYKCGIVRQPHGPARDHVFTEREVGWYLFPEIGMYTIIQNEVYDLAG